MHRLELRFKLACSGQRSPLLAPLLLTRLAEVAEVAVDAIFASFFVGKRTRLATTDVVTCRSHSWKLSGTKLWLLRLLPLLPLLLCQWGQLNQPIAKKQNLFSRRRGHCSCTSIVCLYLTGMSGTACR